MPDAVTAPARVLLLPGWMNSGPGHWQSRWEARHGWRRVEQDDWQWPRRGDWMARLDDEVRADPAPAVLAAHSLGCQLVAAWAAHSSQTHRVRAALLVAPPDTERDDMPPNLYSWRPVVRACLPFPSLVLASSDDPYCSVERARAFAAGWGSGLRLVGALGHINHESGLGDWPEGRALLDGLAAGGR